MVVSTTSKLLSLPQVAVDWSSIPAGSVGRALSKDDRFQRGRLRNCQDEERLAVGDSGFDLYPGGVWCSRYTRIARRLMCVAACSSSSGTLQGDISLIYPLLNPNFLLACSKTRIVHHLDCLLQPTASCKAVPNIMSADQPERHLAHRFVLHETVSTLR